MRVWTGVYQSLVSVVPLNHVRRRPVLAASLYYATFAPVLFRRPAFHHQAISDIRPHLGSSSSLLEPTCSARTIIDKS